LPTAVAKEAAEEAKVGPARRSGAAEADGSGLENAEREKGASPRPSPGEPDPSVGTHEVVGAKRAAPTARWARREARRMVWT